jgi:hypothetical protein
LNETLLKIAEDGTAQTRLMKPSHFWVSPNVEGDVLYVCHVPRYVPELIINFALNWMTGSFGLVELCYCFANCYDELHDLKFPLVCDKHSGFLGASKVLENIVFWINDCKG